MEQRTYRGDIDPEGLADALVASFNHGDLMAQEVRGQEGHLMVSNSQYGVKCVRSRGFSRILSVGQSPGRVLMISRSEICRELHDLMSILRSSFVKIRAIRGGKCPRPDEKCPVTLDGATIASEYSPLKPLLCQNENCCSHPAATTTFHVKHYRHSHVLATEKLAGTARASELFLA
jgi:hypothetical protein